MGPTGKKHKGPVQLWKRRTWLYWGGNRKLGGIAGDGAGRPACVRHPGIPILPHDAMNTGENMDAFWRLGGIRLGEFV